MNRSSGYEGETSTLCGEQTRGLFSNVGSVEKGGCKK